MVGNLFFRGRDCMELLPIVLACAIWERHWIGGVVTSHCDNTAAVSVINSGYSRVPNIILLLRCLFFIRAHFQLEGWAVHTPGVENGRADAISQNNVSFPFAGTSSPRLPGANPTSPDSTASRATARLDVSGLGLVVWELFRLA